MPNEVIVMDPSLKTAIARRELLRRAGCGAGMLGLTALLQDEGLLTAKASAADPLAPQLSHFHGKAKSVIWLFINGGPSRNWLNGTAKSWTISTNSQVFFPVQSDH